MAVFSQAFVMALLVATCAIGWVDFFTALIARLVVDGYFLVG